MFKYFLVCLISVLMSVALLCVERLAGIDWNYSIDAVTYTNTSKMVFDSVIADPTKAPNNGYYILVALMQSSVWFVTVYNICLFGVTSMLFAKAHWNFFGAGSGKMTLLLMILVMNPYRMHLATTMLKDTTVIFLLTLALSRIKFNLLAWLPLLIVRLGSIFYGWIFLNRKILFLALISLSIGVAFYYQPLTLWLQDSNSANMRFREYDLVPNFLEYGFIGILVRAVTWPFMLMSGAFIFFSPSIMFVPIAVGSLMLQMYSLIVLRRFAFTLGAYISMLLLGLIVTGFTTYVRYCYPILVVLPILVMRQQRLSSWSSPTKITLKPFFSIFASKIRQDLRYNNGTA